MSCIGLYGYYSYVRSTWQLSVVGLIRSCDVSECVDNLSPACLSPLLATFPLLPSVHFTLIAGAALDTRAQSAVSVFPKANTSLLPRRAVQAVGPGGRSRRISTCEYEYIPLCTSTGQTLFHASVALIWQQSGSCGHTVKLAADMSVRALGRGRSW